MKRARLLDSKTRLCLLMVPRDVSLTSDYGNLNRHSPRAGKRHIQWKTACFIKKSLRFAKCQKIQVSCRNLKIKPCSTYASTIGVSLSLTNWRDEYLRSDVLIINIKIIKYKFVAKKTISGFPLLLLRDCNDPVFIMNNI